MSELMINKEMVDGSQEQYDAIEMAIQQLSSTTESEYEKIKKEKWFTRVFDMVTGAKNVKDKKKLANQIGTLAQAQQILVEILLRLSENDKNISEIVKQNALNIDKLSENDLVLLERIKLLELKALGIKKFPSMRLSNEEDKKILISCLHKVAECQIKPSEEQIDFYNRILSFYKTDEVQMTNPFANFEKMDLNEKTVIYINCLMYVFLKNDTFDFDAELNVEKLENILEEFDFGIKTTKELKEQIESNYRISGVEGFLRNNYDDSIDEIFYSEIDLGENQEENIEVFEESIEMSDELINSILYIKKGEIKTFKNKNIHISAFINCEGTLELENCILLYNESENGDEITLDLGANLFVKNSKIICKGYDKKRFITCKGNNNVVFEKCMFVDCSNFIRVVQAAESVHYTIKECELINCYCYFVDITSWGRDCCADISDNYILLNEYKERGEYNELYIFYIVASEVLFKNNIVEASEEFTKTSKELSWNLKIFLNCTQTEVSNCTFIGLRGIIHTSHISESKFLNCIECIKTVSDNAIIENCVFENCTDVIYTYSNASILNSQFNCCYDRIIFESGLLGGVRIEFCEFYNLKNSIEYDSDSIACITFWCDSGTTGKCSFVKKCIFDGVELNDNFLIQTRKKVEKPREIVAKIVDCDFKNCSTKRSSGKIIKLFTQYLTLLMKTKEVQTIEIDNCRGLERINLDGSQTNNVNIRKVATNGKTIGATIAREVKKGAIVTTVSSLVGAISPPLGFVGGVIADAVINASTDYELTEE